MCSVIGSIGWVRLGLKRLNPMTVSISVSLSASLIKYKISKQQSIAVSEQSRILTHVLRFIYLTVTSASARNQQRTYAVHSLPRFMDSSSRLPTSMLRFGLVRLCFIIPTTP